MDPAETYYLCQRCTTCCRWPGEVALTEEDTLWIANHLGLSVHEFVQRHTSLRADRRGLTLLSRDDGSCEFLDGRDCAIQPVKPRQCRGFPNEWRFPGWREKCEALEIPMREWQERPSKPTEGSTAPGTRQEE